MERSRRRMLSDALAPRLSRLLKRNGNSATPDARRANSTNSEHHEFPPGLRLGGLPLAVCTIGPGGQTLDGRRTGVDLLAPMGSTVMAISDGKVVYSGSRGGLGDCVAVLHGDGRISRYSHLGERQVKRSDRVLRGQAIGAVGCTGMVARPLLRLDVLWERCYCDPLDYLLATGCLSVEAAAS